MDLISLLRFLGYDAGMTSSHSDKNDRKKRDFRYILGIAVALVFGYLLLQINSAQDNIDSLKGEITSLKEEINSTNQSSTRLNMYPIGFTSGSGSSWTDSSNSEAIRSLREEQRLLRDQVLRQETSMKAQKEMQAAIDMANDAYRTLENIQSSVPIVDGYSNHNAPIDFSFVDTSPHNAPINFGP